MRIVSSVFTPIAIGVVLSLNLYSQDTVYARKAIHFLTSKKCFGRGYIHNGLQNAEKFLVTEFKKSTLIPLFDGNYTQSFYHNVNTFPKKCEVKINGKKLRPGIDFIPDPACAPIKGKFTLQKADSVTFFNTEGSTKVGVILKKKLTFSVSKTASAFCSIEMDQNKFKEEIKDIELNIESKLVNDFESKNIGGFIHGSSQSDTMVIFTAHYDHLGGIDDATFFPGANDNASGVSVILNLVKYYKANPSKYKTVFIFFAGEEAGLLGSKYFVDNKTVDLKKIKFLINLDLLGTGDDGIMVVNGAVLEKEFAMLTKINSEKNLVKEIRKRGKAANSDHYWFTEAGVPCFFIYTLGGTTSYHDVYDTENQLPLTDYVDVFKLITTFAGQL
jgi:aminopeptidase YwaD